MTKQNLYREWAVACDEGILSYYDTRAEARQRQQKLGGRKAGYKILQQFLFSREVR